MVKTLEQAIAQLSRLPDADQEQIGRKLLSHVEKLNALRAEIDKGIAAVEVSADNGPWHQARLAAADGIDTWRQWRWDWDAAPGLHTLRVRATDKTGATQTAQRTGPVPNGASGWDSTVVTVT